MNDLILANAQVPAFLQQAGIVTEFDSIGASVSVPEVIVRTNGISVVNGDEVLRKVPSDGELEIIIITTSPVQRSYYASNWDGETATAPDCKSYDGVKPDVDVKNKQCDNCNACPMNAVGSSSTKANAKACRYQRNVAVIIPSIDPNVVLRLSFAALSIFDKAVADNMWRGFNEYVAYLRNTGNIQPFQVITAIRQDPNSTSHKTQFRVVDYIRDKALYDAALVAREYPDMDYVLGKRYDETGADVTNKVSAPAPANKIQVQQVNAEPVKQYNYEASDEFDEVDTYWRKGNECILVKAGDLLPNEQWEEVDEPTYKAMNAPAGATPRKRQRRQATSEEVQKPVIEADDVTVTSPESKGVWSQSDVDSMWDTE